MVRDAYPKTRLFVEPALAEGGQLVLEGDSAHYLQHVMRQKVGAEVALFNGRDGEWRARITGAKKKEVWLELAEQLRAQQPAPDCWMAFAPIKAGRIDWLVEKATELGAAKLLPTITRHTIVDRVKVERLQAHAREAAEQCERMEVPPVETPVKLETLLDEWPKDRPLFFGDESGRGELPGSAFSKAAQGPWGLLVGPEGGFAREELDLLHRLPYCSAVSLGPRVMRADTAAIALLALSMAQRGDWEHKPAFRHATE